MQQALLERIEEKDKALRLARKVARETAERREKQNVRGEKANMKKGVPRIVLNSLQSKSEKSTAKLNNAHQEKAGKLTDERNQLKSSLPSTAVLKPISTVPLSIREKYLLRQKRLISAIIRWIIKRAKILQAPTTRNNFSGRPLSAS